MPQLGTAEYTFDCIKAPTCDLLADTHGRECEAVNQQARQEFYGEIAADGIADKVRELVEDYAYAAATAAVTTHGSRGLE